MKVLPIEAVQSKTMRSNELLDIARRYAQQAVELPDEDDKRKWLEQEAGRLLREARALTDEAREQWTATRADTRVISLATRADQRGSHPESLRPRRRQRASTPARQRSEPYCLGHRLGLRSSDRGNIPLWSLECFSQVFLVRVERPDIKQIGSLCLFGRRAAQKRRRRDDEDGDPSHPQSSSPLLDSSKTRNVCSTS